MIAIICLILLGALSGYIAGWLIQGEGYGFWKNAGLGIVGGMAGSVVLSIIGIKSTGLIGGIIVAVLGALLCVWLYGKIWG